MVNILICKTKWLWVSLSKTTLCISRDVPQVLHFVWELSGTRSRPRCLLGRRYADEPWKCAEAAAGGACAVALPPGVPAVSEGSKKAARR